MSSSALSIMCTFQQTCKELKKAIPLDNAPTIQTMTQFQDPGDLKKKVEDKHGEWLSKHLPPGSKRYNLKFSGCYPIDDFTGLNLLKVLCKMLNENQYQPGNVIYLSLNGKPIAALMFVLHNVLSITVRIMNQDLKGMFTKLFDETEIQKRQSIKERSQYYLEEDIRNYRKKAKSEYYNFFRQTRSEFLSGKIMETFKLALWNSFFGVIVAVANRMSKRGNLSIRRSSASRIDHIPFLACVKFAFDVNESGKVSELLGEIGKPGVKLQQDRQARMHEQERHRRRRTLGEQIEQRKADCVVKTATHLIKKKIPLHDELYVCWPKRKVVELVEEVKVFYSQPANQE